MQGGADRSLFQRLLQPLGEVNDLTLAGIASNLSIPLDELRQQFTSEQGKAMLASLDSGVIPQTAAQAYIKAVPGFAVPILEYWAAYSLATAS